MVSEVSYLGIRCSSQWRCWITDITDFTDGDETHAMSGNIKSPVYAGNQHRPAYAEPIEDARLRLQQAASAVRSAASVAPHHADDLAYVHDIVINAITLLEKSRP